MNSSKKPQTVIWLAVLTAALALICLTLRTPGTASEEYLPGVYQTIWSLLPPVVAISLALVTKEVYFSLFMGIVTGGLLYANGNLGLALKTILYHDEGGLVNKIANQQNASILVFVVLLAALVALGVLIFVDDGFNCMTVGSVIRPVTDRHQVSRAKLAYLIDSTAAPVCIIAPISSWAPDETSRG